MKVQHYHIGEDIYRDGYIGPLGSGAVGRLADDGHAEIGRMFTAERP
ncbi:hypothetical protein [Salinicoccus jeotgali]